METTNYKVKVSEKKEFNYTQTNKSSWYQKSLEIREYILFKMVDSTVPIYKYFFKPPTSQWEITMDDLQKNPEGSLGRDWFDFYKEQHFTITDNYEEHDICHVLLGYKTSIVEETKMYSFLFGTGKVSIPTFFTIVIGCLVLPEFAKEFYQDYLKGKRALYFQDWDFRYLLGEKTETLRKMIFREKTKNKTIII